MTRYFKILYFLLFLGASLGSLDSVACGKMKDTSEKKSCCKTEKKEPKKEKDCCKAEKEAKNQEHNDCGGNCDHPSCKCLVLLTPFVLPTTLDINHDFQFAYKEVSISYHQVSDTTAGFYSNWQPPKIS